MQFITGKKIGGKSKCEMVQFIHNCFEILSELSHYYSHIRGMVQNMTAWVNRCRAWKKGNLTEVFMAIIKQMLYSFWVNLVILFNLTLFSR